MEVISIILSTKGKNLCNSPLSTEGSNTIFFKYVFIYIKYMHLIVTQAFYLVTK